LADTAFLRRDDFGIEVRQNRPRGWRTFTSEPVRQTDTAIQIEYYDWLLWGPKSRCFRVGEDIVTHISVVEAAKDHESAERS
jgi:hypothetical protein